MGIFAWIVLGLIAGLIARAIYPGKQPGGVVTTILLGIVGALVGGWAGRMLTGGPAYNELGFGGIVWAVLGSLVVLFLYTFAARKKTPKPL
jgi:uncharacterized membrane protein YeaQ/YmgE (transglycosylase-associated protein family)